MRVRLNGWQRIGVLLSVIWFVGFAGYVWTGSNRQASDFYSSELRTCLASLEAANAYTTSTSGANWAKFEECKSEAKKVLYLQLDANRSWLGLSLLFGIDLIIIAMAWFVVWLAIFAARWIGRGFRPT